MLDREKSLGIITSSKTAHTL